MDLFSGGASRLYLLASAGALFALAPVVAGHSLERRDRDDEVVRILWRDPGPIGERDLFWGPGAPDAAPVPPFTLVRETTSGTKPKVDVIDARGDTWRVKLTSDSSTGEEVHAEIAASRIMWAVGYLVEEHYFVPEGRIEGVAELRRAAAAIGEDGAFRTARFEKRPGEITRAGRWEFDRNPFTGTPELSGLTILAMLLANWDARSGNTAVLQVPGDGDRMEEWYILSDLGTAFGRMSGGPFRRPTRWNLEHYAGNRFIRSVAGSAITFHHRAYGIQDPTVPLEHARWFTRLISQLRPAQVRDAFEAAGASAAEVDGFSTQLLARIDELRKAVGE